MALSYAGHTFVICMLDKLLPLLTNFSESTVISCVSAHGCSTIIRFSACLALTWDTERLVTMCTILKPMCVSTCTRFSAGLGASLDSWYRQVQEKRSPKYRRSVRLVGTCHIALGEACLGAYPGSSGRFPFAYSASK